MAGATRMDATMRPIWDWCPESTPVAAANGWEGPACSRQVTKRGNRYLRRLLVQGAWSVLRYAHRSEDRLSRWARQVTCLLQAGGPHHLVDAVSRRRVPAGLRHAQASLRQE